MGPRSQNETTQTHFLYSTPPQNYGARTNVSNTVHCTSSNSKHGPMELETELVSLFLLTLFYSSSVLRLRYGSPIIDKLF